ncbi:Grap2 and cyclin-D-interacting-domain-containing protein [Trametes polyzona]|nr:Grap2 and cyclin-D-interacting-domain-containing protein [Trametes polyzona]
MSDSQNSEHEKGMSTGTQPCCGPIDALRQPLSPTQTSLLSERPTVAVLHKDFQSLLTLIYTSTTKLTLVLRPSAPSPAAALAPIRDLGTSITSLATCASLFDLHGLTLSSDARNAAHDICDGVRSLASTFIDDAGEEYLVRTGTVHDLIERARRELPADNLAAVKKRWKADRGMLEDSLEDINSMVEDADKEDEEDANEEDFDDEWDELGFGSSKKMSDIELERTKKVQPLVRFATLLHKRVVPDVLAGLSGPQLDSEPLTAALDALPSRSHAVVLALEELVAALYAPQKPAALASAVAAFSDATRRLHASVVTDALLPREADLAVQMGGLSVQDASSGKEGGETKVKKDPRKWFDACRAQIDKSAKAVEELLSPDLANAT